MSRQTLQVMHLLTIPFQTIINAWPTLPAAIKTAILALVRSGGAEQRAAPGRPRQDAAEEAKDAPRRCAMAPEVERGHLDDSGASHRRASRADLLVGQRIRSLDVSKTKLRNPNSGRVYHD
jgi:hypothetical protein